MNKIDDPRVKIKKERILAELTEHELMVLCNLHLLGGGYYGYGDCYWVHNSILSSEGNIPSFYRQIHGKNGLSKILKKLRDLGFARYARGLMNDDGEVCGSGNAPHPDCQDALEEICEQRGWL